MLIGAVEALGLISDKAGPSGGFWSGVGTLNDNFSNLGFFIIITSSIFIAAWAISYIVYKGEAARRG
ncbi:hypothetical protein FJ546_30605 [Mesorhizobium sp. B2-4-19]|uniref:hypothetical protein n=1 Tax=Mesorhizobium sp. B2-4-19 TaxID=2589930 RepID=UPI00112BDF12|nr:hypothetical protein [Mesorhizobium sp. B2-4-19]TPK53017.1 hypothetical protein FJ546_30605 [Mesorhizobium sp. B2-4-19]